MNISNLRTSTLRTTLIAAGLTLLGLSTAHAQATYAGDAFGIRQDEDSSVTYYGEAGPIPSSGGTFTGSLTSYSDLHGYASSGAGNASLSASGGVMNASSTLNGFTFTYNGHTASASSMTATASADLSSISGSVTYTNLFVTGSGIYTGAYDGTVPANTIFDFGDGASLELNREVTGLGVVSGPTVSNYDTAYGMQAYQPGVFSIQAAVAGAEVDNDIASTPEPGSIALLTGLSLSGSVFLKRRRKSRPVT